MGCSMKASEPDMQPQEQLAIVGGRKSVRRYWLLFDSPLAFGPGCLARSSRIGDSWGMRPRLEQDPTFRRTPQCHTISRRLGFESEFYFSRRFKHLIGTSPRDYRQRTATLAEKERLHFLEFRHRRHGLVLAEAYGWGTGFFLFGTAGLAVAAVLYLFLREPERGAADRTP